MLVLTRQGEIKHSRSPRVGKPKDTGQSFPEKVASELGLEEWVGSQHMQLIQDIWT